MQFQTASATSETARVLPGSFAGMSCADAHPKSAPVKVVSIERKPTVFYPIGWMAIIATAAWFSWLVLG